MIDGYIAWRDIDYFKFEVKEGVSYQIDLDKETIEELGLGVVDAEGTEIVAEYSRIDDRILRVFFKASYDGTLYARVSDYRALGTYNISFSLAD